MAAGSAGAASVANSLDGTSPAKPRRVPIKHGETPAADAEAALNSVETRAYPTKSSFIHLR
jgi:hypothetical protein